MATGLVHPTTGDIVVVVQYAILRFLSVSSSSQFRHAVLLAVCNAHDNACGHRSVHENIVLVTTASRLSSENGSAAPRSGGVVRRHV